MTTLQQLLDQRILVLDGAMGTMIQRYGLGEKEFRSERFALADVELKGNNDLLCLTAPHIIDEIHRAYLEAGADIIETNTFNASAISMADYRLEGYVSEINLAAARLARQAADDYTTPQRPRFVARSVGPPNQSRPPSPHAENPAPPSPPLAPPPPASLRRPWAPPVPWRILPCAAFTSTPSPRLTANR